jgi:cysteine desulfurase / selenocysteine lyase
MSAQITQGRASPVKKSVSRSFDAAKVRADFPILTEKIRGKPLVYLDNANTTQKPRAVLEALEHYYRHDNANIHRSSYLLSERATAGYEGTRAKVQRFLNALRPAEIVFTRNATEGINLVAQSFARGRVKPGDEILISEMEHHANIVPWQILCEEKGAVLKAVPFDAAGELIMEEYDRLLGPRTKMVAIVQMSNSLGTINPVREMIGKAHARGIPVLVDGAQAAYHSRVDVQEMDCDFYVFSGHKLYGPTGIGVLYGKYQHLDAMPPYQGGGDMIRSVTIARTTYNDVPHKFEAGTPHIAGAIGLGAAIDYLQSLGMDNISQHEQSLLAYGSELLTEIPGLQLYGRARQKASILSFTLAGIHPHDAGTVLDGEGIAVRTGQHCTQPVMDHFGIPATVRASLGLYNTRQEIEALATALQKVKEIFD